MTTRYRQELNFFSYFISATSRLSRFLQPRSNSPKEVVVTAWASVFQLTLIIVAKSFCLDLKLCFSHLVTGNHNFNALVSNIWVVFVYLFKMGRVSEGVIVS